MQIKFQEFNFYSVVGHDQGWTAMRISVCRSKDPLIDTVSVPKVRSVCKEKVTDLHNLFAHADKDSSTF